MTTSPRPRTLSIGGATEDLFVSLTNNMVQMHDGKESVVLPLGQKIRVDDVTETSGGGAANTSVALARLGCDAAFCGVVGSDQWGERLLQTLKKEGVETCCATVVEKETSSFSLILRSGSGERVILYEPGANAHLHDATFDKEHARSVDWIFLNHLHEQAMIIMDDILEVLTEKPAIGLSWNPGGMQIKKGMREPENLALLQKTSLLFLNKEEALAFTGTKDTEAAIKALLSVGVQTVFVTDGKNGSTACDGKTWAACPALPTDVIDSTGAGDAFGTGVTWAKMQGFSLPEMLRAGTIQSTSVLGCIGAQAGLLTDIALRQRLTATVLNVDTREL